MATATFNATEPITRNSDGTTSINFTVLSTVYNLARENFGFYSVNGDGEQGIDDYELYRKSTSEELVISFVEDTKGTLLVKAINKVSNGTGTPSANIEDFTSNNLIFSYDSRVPFVENYDIPPTFIAGNRFTVLLGFNVRVTELGTDDFLFEGTNLGTPVLYRSTHLGDWSALPAIPDAVVKGDIFRRASGTTQTWQSAGDLSEVSASIATLGDIISANTAAQFNGATDAANNIVVVSTAIASGITKTSGSTAIGSAAKGDVFQHDGMDWVDRGNLTDLSDITTLGTVNVGANFLSSPGVNDVSIFSADASELPDGTGWVLSGNPTRNETDASKLAEEAQYFALRFPPVPDSASGVFNLSLKEDSVKGPDGSDVGLSISGDTNISVAPATDYSAGYFRWYYYSSTISTIAVSSTGIPAGLTLNNSNDGVLDLTGTTTESAGATGTMTITVSQASITRTLSVSWEVT